MKSYLIRTLFLLCFTFGDNNSLDTAIVLYGQRAQNSYDLSADPGNIDRAISIFRKHLEYPDNKREAGEFLLRSYYYKGKFCVNDDQERKKIYNEGKTLGEKLIKLYPSSAPIHYWYLVNLGSWAEIYGVLPAAREGVANIMRQYSQKIIDIDPNYNDGGGYFMLGAVHLKAPYIPFVLSWPDNKKALEYLTMAFEIGESTPSQTVYLARAMYKNNKKNKAISLLSSLLKRPISEAYKLEDKDQHAIAKQQLREWK